MESYQGYKTGFEKGQVIAHFRSKFGYPPEQYLETKGAVLVGPILKPDRSPRPVRFQVDEGLSDLPLFGGRS